MARLFRPCRCARFVPVTFEIRGRDAAARLGRFTTEHGVVSTPTLLPVINPNLDYIPAKEMRRKFGTEMVITNSYIIRKSEKHREMALAEGVHKVIDWDGPVMTDSGTFQMYVYGKVSVTPQEIVEFQRDIGVDVGTILDIFSTPDRNFEEAEEDMVETVKRAEAATHIKGNMALAATVQGGVHPELRRRCAESYQGMAADFHPIGGVVPLMEQQRWTTLVDAIVAAKQGLDPSRPVHLFGAGHPQMFALAALLGCDFFDSSSYAKYAKDGRMMYEDGTRHLADLIDSPCACDVCSRYTPEELRKAPDRERLIGEHNLAVSFAEIRKIREAIRAGRLWELAMARARTHPSLEDGLRRALDHSAWIETLEPISKPNAFFYTGELSGRRPEVRRARERLMARWDTKGDDVFLLPAPERKPVADGYFELLPRLAGRAVAPAARSVFGPVPFALDGTYPFAQSVEPKDPDQGTREDIENFLQTYAATHNVRVIDWQGGDMLETLHPEQREVAPGEVLQARARAIADYQFGPGAGDALLAGDVVEVHASRKTGKIRTVTVDGEHVLSLRAEDGCYTLKIAGARKLHKAFPFPAMRVVVGADSVPFNRDGKNAFAQFVEKCDPSLRPADECLVVDWADELVACGQLHLAPSEMAFFKNGMAVHVREGNRPSST